MPDTPAYPTLNTNGPIRLGYLGLLDAAPLIVARELGFFRRFGLSVRLHREYAWASLRDRISVGDLHGAQMLAPMTLATHLGLGAPATPLSCAMVLSRNGNGITVSNALHQQLLATGYDLTQPALAAEALGRCQSESSQRLRAGMVYAWSSHTLQLMDWLDSAGLDAERTLDLITVPPESMPDALAQGRIDIACVGEPWNSVAEIQGHGHLLVPGHQIWHNAPEKVLGMRADWQASHPEAYQRLVMALIEACRWLDDPAHHNELAQILGLPTYLDRIVAPLTENNQTLFHPRVHQHFFRQSANFPWESQFLWLLQQMAHRRQIPPGVETDRLPPGLVRADVFQAAAEALGVDTPVDPHKTEGDHPLPFRVPGHHGPVEVGSDSLLRTGREP